MNREQLRDRIHSFLGESTLKTWTTDDLNAYIDMALCDLSCFKLLNAGESQYTVCDGGKLYDIPPLMNQLISVRIGTFMYYPIRPSYRVFYTYDPYKFVVDESAWTADFYQDMDSTTTIYWLGWMRHPDFTDDVTDSMFGPAYDEQIIQYATALAKLKVNEDAAPFFQMYNDDMKSRGHIYKLGQRVIYFDRLQRSIDNPDYGRIIKYVY